MENASLALLIAAGVLLAIIVLTMGVYLMNNLQSTTDTYVRTLDSAELMKYNTNFEVYKERTDISVQEIVSVVSVARQLNAGTTVFVDAHDIIAENPKDKDFEEWKHKLLSNAMGQYADTKIEVTYKFDKIEYKDNGKVDKIYFEKN